MRKSFRIAPLIALTLAVLIVTAVSSTADTAPGLTLVSPAACPTGGCAAGQHLNFSVEYEVGPAEGIIGSNTQVCVYATAGWADYTNGWISDQGLLSNSFYTSGQVNNTLCEDYKGSSNWITGAYADLESSYTSDRLEFALNIDKSASGVGEVIVKVFELGSGGSWSQTPPDLDYKKTISSVSAVSATVYVAEDAAECDTYYPCYINSDDDLADGIGTGLRDAVMAQNADKDILILGDYPIKEQSVLVDKALTIRGLKGGAITTYADAVCSNAMLSIEAGATLQDLAISDGDCDSPSRTLIKVDSAEDVAIEHNTLSDGNYAIYVKNNSAAVTVAFNQIENNNYHAVYNSGLDNTVDVYANNMINNGSTYQVNCNNHGTADHNFWGEGVTASGSALNCGVVNGKQLGAAIEIPIGGVGVEAIRETVTKTKTYAFANQIAFSTTSVTDFDLILVNHGQGSSSNVPFYDIVGDSLSPCSNHYDVFLAEGASATILELAFKYNLNRACINQIESSAYCGSGDSTKYPLWWYDPATGVTDQWDPTGMRQTTTCNTSLDEINVVIDGTGRPAIDNDLVYTPFLVGVENPDGVKFSQFTATFDGAENDISWTTTEERNIKGFHVLRSDTENGTYARVSPFITANGDAYIGGIYQYSDETISFTRTYYYKIEVVNNEGVTIERYGPVSVLTSTATATVTLTRTPTITRTPYPTSTAAPYYYRSPTSYYRPATATPLGGPTQVRTYGPSPTPSRTSQTKPTYDPTAGEGGYPAEDPSGTEIAQGYPPPEGGADSDRTTTPHAGSSGQDGGGTGTDGSGSGELSGRPRVQWIYLAAGAASGLLLLAATSLVLSKTLIA